MNRGRKGKERRRERNVSSVSGCINHMETRKLANGQYSRCLTTRLLNLPTMCKITKLNCSDCVHSHSQRISSSSYGAGNKASERQASAREKERKRETGRERNAVNRKATARSRKRAPHKMPHMISEEHKSARIQLTVRNCTQITIFRKTTLTAKNNKK